MSNIIDYLHWRGDLSFTEAPVNELDRYILAKVGVPELSGIVPAGFESISLADALRRYFSREDIDPDYFGRLNQPILTKMLRLLPDCPRFREVLLFGYRNTVNPSLTEQLAALTLRLPNGEVFITFRGTDDTITGWKENFLIATRDSVLAQEDALGYLEEMAAGFSGTFSVLGHSKGGNLAFYAAAHAAEAVQDRILTVCNFDGPGFRTSFWEEPGTRRIYPKLRTYLCQHSLIGTLLKQADDVIICRSAVSGPIAHEALNWSIEPTAFVRAERLTPLSRRFDETMDRRVLCGDTQELTVFIEDFFDTLSSTGAVTLTELTKLPLGKTTELLRRLQATPSIRGFWGGVLIDILRESLHDGRSLLNVSEATARLSERRRKKN